MSKPYGYEILNVVILLAAAAVLAAFVGIRAAFGRRRSESAKTVRPVD